MTIDKFRQLDGSYIDEEGVTWVDTTSFFQCKILGLCGCGLPEQNLLYIRDVLRHINRLKEFHEKQISYDEWKAAGRQIMHTEQIEYFTYYVLDSLGLTEHGGSVPGWLTKKGEDLLSDLEEYEPEIEE